MSWFKRAEQVVVDELEAIKIKHAKQEEAFTQDYATGLSILRSVKAEASEYAQKLRAEAAVLSTAAHNISRKFEEPFDNINGDSNA